MSALQPGNGKRLIVEGCEMREAGQQVVVDMFREIDPHNIPRNRVILRKGHPEYDNDGRRACVRVARRAYNTCRVRHDATHIHVLSHEYLRVSSLTGAL